MCATTTTPEIFTAGAPARITAATIKIDREACEEMTCGVCGHTGLDYRPFHMGHRYKAMACCPVCFSAEEI